MRARWLTVALVPLGTMAGHALGYLLAGREAALSGTHSHLRPALWPALAATAAAIVLVAVGRDGPGRRGPRTSGLVVAQVVLFGVVEVVEHLGAGHHGLSFAADPSFRWGVGAQLVSAALLVVLARLAHVSGRLVRERLSRRPVPTPVAGTPHRCHTDRFIGTIRRASSVSERGPPGRPAAA